MGILMAVFNLSVSAQQKGVTPVTNSQAVAAGATYAVVIGISDYQNKEIPKLSYADRDAASFADFLRSPGAGALDEDHLQLLINSDATQAQCAMALDWLVESCKEGDLAIIYFSGHGDVEKKSFSQPGYLLCWNAPSRVYSSGGAYNLRDLQEVINTLSISKNVKVLVIVDACRSGKLSGSGVDGARLTNANLAQLAANETKFLSCHANQYSLEGKQWGGGHGAFSYHLIDGLYGLADRNGDDIITSGELDRYLEDHVIPETKPNIQEPLLVGSKSELLFNADTHVVEMLKKNKSGELPVFKPVKVKGLADRVLATVDSNVRQIYFDFRKAIKDKNFFSPAGNCAEDLYQQLIQVEALAPLYGAMKRKYAAGLQDEAQETLNAWLKTNQEAPLGADARLPLKVFTEKARSYPRHLDRAAELLGEKHYMYATLKARKYFFEGYLLANSNRNPNRELGEHALALFRQSLTWQPEQPQVYWQMGQVFAYNFQQPDSLEHYVRLALGAHPNWTRPCTDAAYWLSRIYHRPELARPFLEQASRMDSSSAEVWRNWAVFNFGKNRAEAERQLKKAIALDSTNANAWINLGWLQLLTKRHADGEPFFKKAIALDSTYAIAWNNLGYMYQQTERPAEAELAYKKAIALDSTFTYTYVNLGNMYLNTHRYAEAEPTLKKAIALDSTIAATWNYLGWLYYLTYRYDKAELFLKKAIALNPKVDNLHRNLGMVYFKTNRPDEARQHFLKAIELAPHRPLMRLCMAYLLFSEGKTSEALGYVEQAIVKGRTFEQLESDVELALMRELPEWKALMKKHFPDKVKD